MSALASGSELAQNALILEPRRHRKRAQHAQRPPTSVRTSGASQNRPRSPCKPVQSRGAERSEMAYFIAAGFPMGRRWGSNLIKWGARNSWRPTGPIGKAPPAPPGRPHRPHPDGPTGPTWRPADPTYHPTGPIDGVVHSPGSALRPHRQRTLSPPTVLYLVQKHPTHPPTPPKPHLPHRQPRL
jgi:hypothetical protein